MGRLSRLLPKLALAPSAAAVLVCVYGFSLWTAGISLTPSTLLPRYEWNGLTAHAALWANPRWLTAVENLAVFAALFVVLALAAGVVLAVLLDQKPPGLAFFRTLFLYPMALSLIVTGVAWKWILNPQLGLERSFALWGLDVHVDWLTRPDRVVYAIVLAAVWQSAGFVMALFFAGLRSLPLEVRHAARLDGASAFAVYRRVLLPQLWPVLFSSVIVLAHNAAKTFDLVVAMTSGGPGYSSELPATFLFVYSFQRNQLAVGAASACALFAACALTVLPYLKAQARQEGAHAR